MGWQLCIERRTETGIEGSFPWKNSLFITKWFLQKSLFKPCIILYHPLHQWEPRWDPGSVLMQQIIIFFFWNWKRCKSNCNVFGKSFIPHAKCLIWCNTVIRRSYLTRGEDKQGRRSTVVLLYLKSIFCIYNLCSSDLLSICISPRGDIRAARFMLHFPSHQPKFQYLSLTQRAARDFDIGWRPMRHGNFANETSPTLPDILLSWCAGAAPALHA